MSLARADAYGDWPTWSPGPGARPAGEPEATAWSLTSRCRRWPSRRCWSGREKIGAALRDLAVSYEDEQRGFDLREEPAAGASTPAECAPVVERFVRDGQEVRLTEAALETLAVVAYRQPRTRPGRRCRGAQLWERGWADA